MNNGSITNLDGFLQTEIKINNMKQALKLILLLVHYAVVAVIVYYVGDIMSRDTSGIGVGPNALVLLLLIISVIQHTKQFILSFKNK